MSIRLSTISLYIAISLLSAAKPALADAIVPVEQILRELDVKVRMPIMLPDRLPGVDQIYPSVSVGFSGKTQGELYYDNHYFVDFNTRPDCMEAPDCRFASFSAALDGNFFFATDRTVSNTTIQFGDRQVQILEVRRIELVDQNGDRIEDVRFTRQCGLPVAPCGSRELATLEWRYGGVMYEATIVNGTLDDVVEMANSAMQGGIRNRVRVP